MKIRILFKFYQPENLSFRELHCMIDLFKSIVKMYTTLILSLYLQNNIRQFSTRKVGNDGQIFWVNEHERENTL